MTAPRLARASRSRFFIAIGVLVLIVGFISLFNSSQQQLDESNALRLRCEQQHDALNSRLQAIVDHKFRLEKNLENERKENLETKNKFELMAKEQKSLHNKQILDAGVRLESSQQHFKILQSKHFDLTENCSKTKQIQSEQINELEKNVKSLQNQISLHNSMKEKELEELRVKVVNLVNEKNHLDVLLKSTKLSGKCEGLENLLKDFKANCDYQPPERNEIVFLETIQIPHTNLQTSGQNLKSDIKSFKEQQLVSKDLYKIPIILNNKINLIKANNSVLRNIDMLDSKINFISSINNQNNQFIGNNKSKRKNHGAIINSVENFQIAPKPMMSSDDQTQSNVHNMNGDGFQQPPPLNPPLKLSSSTKPSEDLKSNVDYIKRALPFASDAHPSSEKYKISLGSIGSAVNKSTTTHANDRFIERAGVQLSRLSKPKILPKGVAPVPENFDLLLKNDEINRSDLGAIDLLPENNDVSVNGAENKNNGANNRYANVVNEFSNNGVINKKDDEDNGAHEVKDGDGKNADSGNQVDEKDNLQEVLNNAAEDDTNNFFDTKNLNKKNNDDVNNDDVENIIGPDNNNNNVLHKKHHNKDNGEDENKLINEVVGDQGKELEFPEDMHLEENNEEDEDEDDYSNPAARQQEGAAIRN